MALTGRAVLFVLLGLVPLALGPSATTVRWWVLVCLLVIAVDVALAPDPRRLRWSREPIEPLHRGESTRTTLEVTNTGSRRMRARVRDAWAPSAGARGERHRLDMRPGASTRLVTDLSPTRRGDRRADLVTVRSFGPLGLAARQRSVEVEGSVRVLPAFPSRRRLPNLLAELRLLDGRSALRTRGQGTEFDSLRDYVAGDDVRSIDWRATARRGGVVVRTWQPERDRHVVLVLDTSRTSAARVADMPRLDSAMDAGLLLTALAARAGDRVDLVAGDRVVRARVVGRRRERVVHEVIEAMAPLEPALVEADWALLAGEVLRQVRGRALVVLLTPLEPTVVEESLLPALSALTRRHRVVIASVQDPALSRLVDAPEIEADGSRGLAGVEAAYDMAAAEQALTRRRHTADVLRRLGVEVVDTTPDELPAALSRHYLALKGRGQL